MIVSASADSVARTSARPESIAARSSARSGARRSLRERVHSLAHCHDKLVVARQVAPQVREFAALCVQALRENLLRRQHPLLDAAPEGFLLQPCHPLERARVLQAPLRIETQEPVGGHEAVVGRELSVAHLTLQRAARHADEARGPGEGEPLGHEWIAARSAVASCSRDPLVVTGAVEEPGRC